MICHTTIDPPIRFLMSQPMKTSTSTLIIVSISSSFPTPPPTWPH
ncbi:hypothetical protein Goari_002420 [Gossypium aridum]|uniref:Uncharacterized protein n=1 Tax=Gossypium aridum TaxID=34290 RepID=A0A7J8Y8A5_GOSAI|nr:hypothetical protein [Gossypium aridum]